VRGIQDAGVIACSKHFILNEQEHFRQPGNFEDQGFVDAVSSNVDDKTLHELYLWPFADAVRAGTGAIMCSYNKANNSQACQNSYLQNYILKGELGFQGFIVRSHNHHLHCRMLTVSRCLIGRPSTLVLPRPMLVLT
jgi:beta-glucosidase